MRLTDIMFTKLPKGHIFRGKYRLVKQVTGKALRDMRFDYAREERNMLLLRHPYLTKEQSFGHMSELRPPKTLDWQNQKILKFNKVTTLEDRLMHLRVKDVWD